MAKIVVVADEGDDQEAVKRAVEAAQQQLKPQPDANGDCNCGALRDIRYMDFDCSYCRRCGGNWY